jgi:hypothetical protein
MGVTPSDTRTFLGVVPTILPKNSARCFVFDGVLEKEPRYFFAGTTDVASASGKPSQVIRPLTNTVTKTKSG